MRAIMRTGLAIYVLGIACAAALAQSDGSNTNTNINTNVNLNGSSWQSQWSTNHSSSTESGGNSTNANNQNININQNTNGNWIKQAEQQPSPSQFSNQFLKQWQQEQAQRQQQQNQQPQQQALPPQSISQPDTPPAVNDQSQPDDDSNAHIFDNLMNQIFNGWITTEPSTHEYSVDTPGAPKSEMATTPTGLKYEIVTGGADPDFKIIGPFPSISAHNTLEMYERQLEKDRPGSIFSTPIDAAGKGWTGKRAVMSQQGLGPQIVIAAKVGWTPLVYILMAPSQPPAEADRFISSFNVDPGKAWEAHPEAIAEARTEILTPLVILVVLVIAIAAVGLTRSKHRASRNQIAESREASQEG